MKKNMKTIFAVPVEIQDTDCCFNEKCGKIKIGGLIIKNVACIPCYEKECPFLDKELTLGKQTFEWGTEMVVLRKLKYQKGQ